MAEGYIDVPVFETRAGMFRDTMVLRNRLATGVKKYAPRFSGRRCKWRASRSAHAGFVLDALEQALHNRRPMRGGGLVHHADRRSQYVSIKYTGRLAEAGIEPSVGNIGDSHDNALAETINVSARPKPSIAVGHGAASRQSSMPRPNGSGTG